MPVDKLNQVQELPDICHIAKTSQWLCVSKLSDLNTDYLDAAAAKFIFMQLQINVSFCKHQTELPEKDFSCFLFVIEMSTPTLNPVL